MATKRGLFIAQEVSEIHPFYGEYALKIIYLFYIENYIKITIILKKS